MAVESKGNVQLLDRVVFDRESIHQADNRGASEARKKLIFRSNKCCEEMIREEMARGNSGVE